MIKKAFSLAEILITLTILGVLAAIITPNITNQFQNTITLVKLKKTYANITNSIDEAYAINNCDTIKCVKQKSNITYIPQSTNYPELLKQLNVLNLFIPDAKPDIDFTCTPKKIYDLSGNQIGEAIDTYNPSGLYMINSGSYFAYCLNNNIGLLLNHFSAFRDSPYCEERNISCLSGYIYAGSKNSKRAIVGKNMFKIDLNTKNELRNCDLKTIIQNQWKINY